MKRFIIPAAVIIFAMAIPFQVSAQVFPGEGPPPTEPPSIPPPGQNPYPNYDAPQSGQPMMAAPVKERRGFYGGGGFGAGILSPDEQSTGEDEDSISFHLDVGYRFNPRLAIFAEVWTMAFSPENNRNVQVVQTMSTLGVQYWFEPRLWVKGGFSNGKLDLKENGESIVAPVEGRGLSFGVGYAVMHTPGYSIDAELKYGIVDYTYDSRVSSDENANVKGIAFTISIHWHQLRM